MDNSSIEKTNEIVKANQNESNSYGKKQVINSKGLLNNWKALLGITATLLGISGGIITLNEYFSEKPNLSTNIEQMKLVLSLDILNSKSSNIIDDLQAIERDYGDVTGEIIIRAAQEIDNILKEESKSSENVTQEIQTIIDEVLRKIDQEIVTTEKGEYSPVNSGQYSKKEFEEYKKQRLEKLKKLKDNQFFEKYKGILKAINLKDRKISVNLLVENSSRIKNGLRKTAVMRFYKDRNTTLPITLLMKKKDRVSIDANSFTMFTLESSKIKDLAQEEYKFIESAFENEYSYILMVQDINGKTWYSEGKALSFNISKEEHQLQQETLRIIEEKF